MEKLLKALKLWLRVVRAQYFSASIAPIVVGSTYAYAQGFFALGFFLLTLLAGLLIHAGTNVNNDYFDYQNGLDTYSSLGSSGVLVAKLLPPQTLRTASLILLLGGTLVGLVLAWLVRSSFVALIAILGALAGYYYTAPPLHLKYRALGVPLVFVMMGLLLVTGSYYIQTRTFNYSFLVSLPVAFLVAAILHANEMRDLRDDRKAGIQSLTMHLGAEGARALYMLLLAGPYAVILLAIPARILPLWSLLVFFSFPLTWRLWRLASQYPFTTAATKKGQRLVLLTVLQHIQVAALLTIAFLFAHYF